MKMHNQLSWYPVSVCCRLSAVRRINYANLEPLPQKIYAIFTYQTDYTRFPKQQIKTRHPRHLGKEFEVKPFPGRDFYPKPLNNNNSA